MDTMLKILIADDHPLYRDAIRSALTMMFDELTLIESEDISSTISQLEAHPDTDLLLLDLNMPGSSGLFGLIHIRKLFVDLPIAVVSGMTDSRVISKAIHAGAQGFITKTANASTIASAINSVLEGDIWTPEDTLTGMQSIDPEFEQLTQKVSTLTPAQYKILCYLKDGLLNKQIAADLSISEATVKAHITAVFKKLSINNRSQAVIIANQLQLLA